MMRHQNVRSACVNYHTLVLTRSKGVVVDRVLKLVLAHHPVVRIVMNLMPVYISASKSVEIVSSKSHLRLTLF